MLKILTFLFLCIALVFSGPMESLTNYNVILVHGAADRWGGMDCAGDTAIKAPYNVIKINEKDYNYSKRIGGLYKDGKKQSSATGMIKELGPWLRDTIFEHDTLSVYLQRPFTKPAGSPFENGREIGWSGWSGNDKCSERRSLIEEAQEVKAEGRGNLSKYRGDIKYRDSLPPSRNILIAHSMGGVASREYVQSDSIYNDDVDKVITLDSPHEGTGALNLLVEMNKPGIYLFEGFTNGVVLTGIAAAILAASDEPLPIRYTKA